MSETTSPLYTHPTIRNEHHDRFIARLEDLRARRLVTAMEHKAAVTKRLQVEHEKLNHKWETLCSKIDKKLYALQEAIEAAEADVNKLIALNNQMAIME